MSRREGIIVAIDIAVDSGARLFKACDCINLCMRKLRRWRMTPEDMRKGGYRAVGQKLSESEKDDIVHAIQAPEMINLPIKVIHATLLDMGICLGSPSTFLRVISQRCIEINKQKHKNSSSKRPELRASGPNQVYCWDITWLESRLKGSYFYLYMVIDMYSRKVVAWEVYAKESGVLARGLFSQAFDAEGISGKGVIVHADNGKPMRSLSLQGLFNRLEVIASYGRPHTSNDNAFAESLFATFKGRICYPEYFVSLDSARDFCLEFFTWYNGIHLHSNLDYMTPINVHNGTHTEIFNKRNELQENYRAIHPTRHGGTPKVYGIPKEVKLKHRTLVTTKD